VVKARKLEGSKGWKAGRLEGWKALKLVKELKDNVNQ